MTGVRILRVLSLVLGLSAGLTLAAPAAVLAQAGGALQPAQTARDQAAPEGPELLVRQQESGTRSPPLGASLFASRPPEVSTDIVDPGHVLRPGDAIRVTLWGMVDSDQELVIDTQGNVVVPGVGPVNVAGVTAAEVPNVIQSASRQVYSEGVQVYAAPTTVAATRVLVTGPVARPGAYAGSSDDALVVYLQRAGGIDPVRGSYRRIRVVRNGETVARADLYDFLREGLSPQVSFRAGDAIVVEDQGPVVSVSGDARAPFTFELAAPSEAGAELMRHARPTPDATHAAVVGVRQGEPFATYLTLAEFAAFALQDGDRVRFESDVQSGVVLVRIEGEHEGPSVVPATRGATVGQMLAQTALKPDAEMETIHLRRESVRQTQRQMLDESLDRLERAVFLAPARTPAEAQARSASMNFITQFIERARQVEPTGVLALAGQDLNQVRLETGDVIVIPRRSQVVSIAGEVNAPQSILALRGGRVSDYVREAGGFTRRADRRNVMVFRQDGRLREGGRAEAGDRILVVGKPDSTLIPLIRDLTQTLFQMAGVFLVFDDN